MGMDLIPCAPSQDAPRDENNQIVNGRYNWSGWKWLAEHLVDWGVNTDELAELNDGDVISDRTCKIIADTIEQHLSELTIEDQTWIKQHIILWRTCGGYEQW